MLYLGRCEPGKNLGAAVAAMAHLPPECKLLMVGGGHPPAGLDDRIRALPPVPHVGDALAGADCLVHPSRAEADCLAIKEAFMAGLPAVYTPAGSIPEIEAMVDAPAGGSTSCRAPPTSTPPSWPARSSWPCPRPPGRSPPRCRHAPLLHWTAKAMCAPLGRLPGRDRRAMSNAPATDYTKPRPLPAEIVVPSDRLLRISHTDFAYHQLVPYIIGTVRGLAADSWRLDGAEPAPPYARGFPAIKVDASTPTAVRESDQLIPLDWSSFPVLVDGIKVIVDFSDWHFVRAGAPEYKHWLRMHVHSGFKCYRWMGSFPPATFMDWAYYDRIQRETRERRDPQTVTAILNNQRPGVYYDSRHRRRFMVRGMLDHAFGDRADFELTGYHQWHAKAEHALCYVQVPGSWENMIDRGQLQMIGLGIPTISPILYDQSCDGLLQPGIHYLACRQDYRDIPELVRWCETHRDEAAAIGRNAWLFFQEFCTPLAIWSYIKDRIVHGPRHWRGNIDDDLSPPCLYDTRPGGMACAPGADTMPADGP